MSEGSDDALIVLARRQAKRLRKLLLLMSLLFPLGTVLVNCLAMGRPDAEASVIYYSGSGLLAVFVAMLLVIKVWMETPEVSLSPSILDQRTDEVQGEIRNFFRLTPYSLLLLAVPSSWAVLDLIQPADTIHMALHSLLLVGWGLGSLGNLMILAGVGAPPMLKQIFDDELFRANRAAGIRCGFYVALAGMALVLGLGIYRPQWGIAALPALISATISAAGLRFAALERQTNRAE